MALDLAISDGTKIKMAIDDSDELQIPYLRTKILALLIHYNLSLKLNGLTDEKSITL